MATFPELASRVVAITGAGGPEDVRRSRAKGFSAHLVKPVSASSLRTLLK